MYSTFRVNTLNEAFFSWARNPTFYFTLLMPLDVQYMCDYAPTVGDLYAYM